MNRSLTCVYNQYLVDAICDPNYSNLQASHEFDIVKKQIRLLTSHFRYMGSLGLTLK